MNEYTSDTNALIWHLIGSPRLTPPARLCFDQADRGQARIHIPTICAVELIFLSERGRIPAALVQQTLALANTPGGSYTLAALNENVIQTVSAVPRQAVPEMPDRVITATALALQLPLITSDHVIHAAAVVPIIW